MREQTGDTYVSSRFAKALMLGPAKLGKTVFEIAGALGVLPWQKYGGIVSSPDLLYIISFDADAVGGAQAFLKETCGAPDEALKFHILNMEEDVRKLGSADWDFSLYNATLNAIALAGDRIRRAKGVGCIIVSSVTGLATALERALGGPPGKKQTMDQSKWGEYNRQVAEIRNKGQLDEWHTIWEGHVLRMERESQKGSTIEETMPISGKAGQYFPYNVEQVFMVKRNINERYEKTAADFMYLDCRPNLQFLTNGRLFTERLDAQEPDITVALGKLGKEVGHWGMKGKKK